MPKPCVEDCRCGKHARGNPDTWGMSDVERFWFNVDIGDEDQCWLWKLSIYKDNGYGQTYFRGRKRCAHTVAYQLSNPNYDPNLETDHKCHVHRCCNPAHLRQATHKQNMENRSGLNSNNTSGFRGVRKYGRRWRAEVKHNRQAIHLGTFDTAEQASEAAEAKRKELFTHES